MNSPRGRKKEEREGQGELQEIAENCLQGERVSEAFPAAWGIGVNYFAVLS